MSSLAGLFLDYLLLCRPPSIAQTLNFLQIIRVRLVMCLLICEHHRVLRFLIDCQIFVFNESFWLFGFACLPVIFEISRGAFGKLRHMN